MIARRRLLSSGFHGACLLCCSGDLLAQTFPPSAATSAKKIVVAPACGFGGEDVQSLIQGPKTRRCGVRELDDIISDELDLMQRIFKVQPEFTFVDGTAGGGAHTGRINGGKSSLIVVDIQLVHKEIKISPSFWKSAMIGILAHEFAHAFQYDSALEESRVWETHADFLSGWYMGTKVSMGLSGLDVNTFADALFRRGSKTGFFDERGYGPADARVRSMRAGLNAAKSDAEPGKLSNILLAAEAGYAYAASTVK